MIFSLHAIIRIRVTSSEHFFSASVVPDALAHADIKPIIASQKFWAVLTLVGVYSPYRPSALPESSRLRWLILFSFIDAAVLDMRSSSSSVLGLCFPHSLQTTTKIPPSKAAPPMPPTTPPINLLEELLRPLDDDSLSFKLGRVVHVAKPVVAVTTVFFVTFSATVELPRSV